MESREKEIFDEVIAWQRFKDGDQEALGTIFQYYFQEIYYYGLKIARINDLVKDTIQDMFIRFWERREKLGEVKNIKAYLLITLRRELIKKTKITQLQESEMNSDLHSFAISIEDFLIEEEDAQIINKKLVESFEKLTPRQREVIFLRFYHSLDFPELAELLEMNVQSVRNLLFRGLESVRQNLNDVDSVNSDNLEIILFQLFSLKK